MVGAVGGALYICNNITAVLVFPLACHFDCSSSARRRTEEFGCDALNFVLFK